MLTNFFADILHFFGGFVDVLTDFLGGVVDALTKSLSGALHLFSGIVDTLTDFLGRSFFLTGRQTDNSEGQKSHAKCGARRLTDHRKFLIWM